MLTREQKWELAAFVTTMLIMVGLAGYAAYDQWQMNREVARFWKEVMPQIQKVPVSESQMPLDEAGFLAALNELRKSRPPLLEWLLASEKGFSYVTVARPEPEHRIRYVISFSKDKPVIIAEQYKGVTGIVRFRWSRAQPEVIHFRLGSEPGSNAKIHTISGGFGFSGRKVLFFTMEMDRAKPILIAPPS